MAQQLIRKYDEDRIMLYGQPFLFSIATPAGLAGYANAIQLTLDGTYMLDLDGDTVLEPSPFMNQELYITALKVVNSSTAPPLGNIFGGLQIDGKLALTGSMEGGLGMLQHLPGQTIYLDAMAKGALPPPAITGQDIYGSPLKVCLATPLLCRNSIRLWADTSAPGDTTTLWLRGFNVPRRA